MSESADVNAWKPSQRQIDRVARSNAALQRRATPTFGGPLYVGDDEEVVLRAGSEVARRALVLWAVELRAEGMPQLEALQLIEQAGLWDAVSPEERLFLNDPAPDDGLCVALVWRLESIYVLLWALGHIPELDWPHGMCNAATIVGLLKPRETDAAFLSTSTLRPVADILDAQDLTLRIHWAIRDAYINHGGFLPMDLDWSRDYDLAHVSQCPAVGVVEQRHYTLNWLTNFGAADWDDVDTPT